MERRQAEIERLARLEAALGLLRGYPPFQEYLESISELREWAIDQAGADDIITVPQLSAKYLGWAELCKHVLLGVDTQ